MHKKITLIGDQLSLPISNYLDFPMLLNCSKFKEINIIFDVVLKPQRYLEILKYIEKYIKDNLNISLTLTDSFGYLNNALSK